MPKKTFFNLPSHKKERILQGAKEVFAGKHYSRVTIDAIVESADIPKGSFYQYFHDKDDLFKHIFSDLGTEKGNLLLGVANKSSESFSGLILNMISESSKFENRDQNMVALKDRFLKECPQSVKEEILAGLMPATMELYETIIQSFIHKGSFRADLDVKSAAFILTCATMNIEYYSDKEGFDYGGALMDICDTLEKGLIRH